MSAFHTRRRRGDGKGYVDPIMLDIKLRYIGPRAPTRRMVMRALNHMLITGGRLPNKRWLVAAIDWMHPDRSSRGWERGALSEFDQFSAIIEKQLAHLKISIDREVGA